jgi:PAS domain S-box-containing protein
MWVSDFETLRFLAVNEAAISHYGYSREEFLAMTVKDIHPPEDVPRLMAYLPEAKAQLGLSRSPGLWRHRKIGRMIITTQIFRHPLLWRGRSASLVLAVDVTERKHSEKAVQQLAAIVESSDDAILSKTLEGNILSWNKSAERIYGYSAAELEGKPVCILVPPGHGDEVQRILERIKRGERIDHFETVRVRKDGKRIDVSLTMSPIKDKDGNIIGASTIARDITNQKRAEEALRESEERYRCIVETAYEGIWAIDLEARTMFVNQRAAEILGYTPEEMLGQSVFDFMDTQTVEKVKRILQRRREGIKEQYEISVRRKDRSECWLIVKATPMIDAHGRFQGSFAMVTDITERKQTEQRLREQTAYLNALIEGSPLAIVAHDSQGRTLMCNPAFEHLFQYQHSEIVGRNLDELIATGDLVAEAAIITKRILAGETVRVTTRRRRKDGNLVDVELNAVPLLVGGQLVGGYGLYQDITERSQLEGQLRQAQKMEAIGQLAGGIAHDFNNLLTGILGYSELVLKRLRPGDATHRMTGYVREAALRARELTSHLLAFSRKQVLEPKPVSLNAIVSRVAEMLEHIIGDNIQLFVHLDPQLDPVRVDRNQIEQVILNLVANARDAMPQGGTLILKTANVARDKEFAAQQVESKPGEFAMLEVTDTGWGMDTEAQVRAFEPFFTTKKNSGGTGLGLAMVYGIIKQSGGYIEVESKLGQGSTFRICVPRTKEAPEDDQPACEPNEELRGTETVLVAEDDAIVRKLVCGSLESFGYTVLEARDGLEALRIAEEYSAAIHLLLTDMVMPGPNGQQVSDGLTVLHPETRVIYMSGYPGSLRAQEMSSDCNRAYLSKPFTPDFLARKVRRMLEI